MLGEIVKRARARQRSADNTNHEAVMRRLLAKARDIVADSNAAAAVGFDTEGWLNDWVRTPIPALRGRRPVELLGTKAGEAAVVRVLGAIRSGAYQ